jgi:uncharacterized protein YegP (UPF0339 family)
MKSLVFYKDKKGEYRWRMVAKNGRIIADSGEGYKTRLGVIKGWGIVYCVTFFNMNELKKEMIRQNVLVIDNTAGDKK